MTLEERVERVINRLRTDDRPSTTALADFITKMLEAIPESEREDSDKLDDLLRSLEMEARFAGHRIADTWKLVRDVTFQEKVLDREERELIFEELNRRSVTGERLLRVRSGIIDGLIEEFRHD